MTLDEQLRALVREEVAKALAERTRQVELVTAAEYARMRSISVSTVRAAIREGRLPAERYGRAVRVRSDAVISKAVRPVDAAARARLRLCGGGSK